MTCSILNVGKCQFYCGRMKFPFSLQSLESQFCTDENYAHICLVGFDSLGMTLRSTKHIISVSAFNLINNLSTFFILWIYFSIFNVIWCMSIFPSYHKHQVLILSNNTALRWNSTLSTNILIWQTARWIGLSDLVSQSKVSIWRFKGRPLTPFCEEKSVLRQLIPMWT